MAIGGLPRTGRNRGRSVRLHSMVGSGSGFDYGTKDDAPAGERTYLLVTPSGSAISS